MTLPNDEELERRQKAFREVADGYEERAGLEGDMVCLELDFQLRKAADTLDGVRALVRAVELLVNGAPEGQGLPQGKQQPGWVLSYPSHPDRGCWHKVHPQHQFETLCGRTIREGEWRREKNFPLMDDSVTNRVCKHCHRRDPTP